MYSLHKIFVFASTFVIVCAALLISIPSYASCIGPDPCNDNPDTNSFNYNVLVVPAVILGGIGLWYFSKRKHSPTNYRAVAKTEFVMSVDPYLNIGSQQTSGYGAKITFKF